ncbi:uncharacterized protein LOC127263485 [Andrographis paniculata]|uniref:uncharacterized protein LOC127263485 n=1 Tax=Andrographis paniculata TaxID=175694 RepID=UPI0021E831A9|nr:uncharacterized protein LOC127263485 [Andrographis paniculata]
MSEEVQLSTPTLVRTSMEDDDDTTTTATTTKSSAESPSDNIKIDIPPASSDSRRLHSRIIHRVSPHLRSDTNNRRMFDPVALSLGPYHHGKPDLRRAEALKDHMLHTFVSDSVAADETKDKRFFHNQILKCISEIRGHYDRAAVDSFDDESLSEIILRDACFVATCIADPFSLPDLIRTHLGNPMTVYATQDLLLLENQIPFWVVNRLLNLRFGEEEADAYICQHLSLLCLGSSRNLTRLPWKENDNDDEEQLHQHQPLHLLEAYRITLLQRESPNKLSTLTSTDSYSSRTYSIRTLYRYINLPFRSVTYLQRKGIYFGPSSTCYKDILFTSHWCYGMLRLPIDIISEHSKSFFCNLIAFEMSSSDDLAVTSYVNFMKSLLESPEDVKVLREKGILFSDLGSDKEVVEAFKEIRTYGIDDCDSFAYVKKQLDEHCNSRAKTWVAELIHNYFHSPWSAIALFAATFLLCLTFIQTYYTVKAAN